MKTNMEDIDKLIKETLTEEEAKFYDELDEQNVFQMLRDLFTGKNSWFMYVLNVVTLAFFGFFILCVIKFFEASDTQELIKWTAGGFASMMTISILKVFVWMQMDKNALLREIKRLELMVSSLASKI